MAVSLVRPGKGRSGWVRGAHRKDAVEFVVLGGCERGTKIVQFY